MRLIPVTIAIGTVVILIGSGAWFFFFRDGRTMPLIPDGTVTEHDGKKRSVAGAFEPFGAATVTPTFSLDGAGTNIDAVAFWETDVPDETILFVSGKGNDVIERWRHPFLENELAPIRLAWRPNGLRVDQVRAQLLVGNSSDGAVEIFSLPDVAHMRTIGKNDIVSGETDVDVVHHADGMTRIFATEDDSVRVFDGASGAQVLQFVPDTDSIEEIVADGFHGTIYVPEESGIVSKKHPRGAVLVYDTNGTPKGVFADGGIFSGDEEGIALYTCPSSGTSDNGRGFLIVVDQAGKDTGFEFFDRMNRKYLGTLTIAGVTGTDGIAITQRALPNFPHGLLAVTDNNNAVALVDMETILEKTGLICGGS